MLAENVLKEIDSKKDGFGASNYGDNKTVIVEYSSPNIAKPFHIGHLRNTVIGSALYNIYKFLNYNTIGINHLGDYDYEVSVDVTNIGNMKAKETVLLFVNKEVDNAYRSVTELKGFDKVELDVNETKTVTLKLNKRSFALYDVNSKDFVVEKGNYVISINKNVSEKILCEEIFVDGVTLPSLRQKTPSYYDLNSFSSMDLEVLLNERITPNLFDKRNPATYDSTLGEIAKKSYKSIHKLPYFLILDKTSV